MYRPREWPQGGRVRPETAAEATGRPPGKSLGAFCGLSIHWWLPNLGGLERDPAFNRDWAGWDYPYPGGLQITQERRVARRTMAARRAGSGHTLVASKLHRSGERRGDQYGRGRLGAAWRWRGQNSVEWRAALRGLEAWRVGSGHARTTAKAAWFGGGGPGGVHPTLPLLTYIPNLIPPADIFEVKIWGGLEQTAPSASFNPAPFAW